MSRSVVSLPAIVAVLISLSLLVTPPVFAGAEKEKSPAEPFLTLGKIGPDAVKFSVWTTPSEAGKLKPGDHVVVHFKAEAPCHIVVANVSEKGDVTIVFPNKQMTDNSVEPGKEYTLFGEKSKLKLVVGKKVARTNLVFYVSPKPQTFVKIPDKQFVMQIRADRKEELKSLREDMEKMAAEKGFNRKIVSIKTNRTGSAKLKLMGGRLKGAPWKGSSETPESVTGTQGRSEDITPE